MKSTNILRTSGSIWNLPTAMGDQYPGSSTQGYTNQPNQYSGQLGAWEDLNYSAAQARSAPTATNAVTLQAGRYQYVQFYASGTAYASGQVLYWKDETNYIVSNVGATATSANIAGFCLGLVTQGYYWFMQISGVAPAQYAASVTGTVIGEGVYIVVNTNTVDALTDATADATAGVNKLFVGIAKTAPANGAIGLVYIRGLVIIP